MPTSRPPSPTNLRTARSAGVAITTSPTQFGRKTPTRMSDISRAIQNGNQVRHATARAWKSPSSTEVRCHASVSKYTGYVRACGGPLLFHGMTLMRIRSLIVVFVLLAPAAHLSAEESRKTSTAPITLTIDASKAGPPINPFIYGQFIEHLGRCIYGGIWAEMLEDRKFFYPITDDYRPYRDLLETKFPV